MGMCHTRWIGCRAVTSQFAYSKSIHELLAGFHSISGKHAYFETNLERTSTAPNGTCVEGW